MVGIEYCTRQVICSGLIHNTVSTDEIDGASKTNLILHVSFASATSSNLLVFKFQIFMCFCANRLQEPSVS